MSSRDGETISLLPVTGAHGYEEHEIYTLDGYFENVPVVT